MAEEPEKRFEAIMDKLFRAPPKPSSKNISTSSSSNRSGAEWSRGKKTPNSSPLTLVDPRLRSLQTSSVSNVTSVEPATCRPWDRDDFLRRLATFKSMTWFAKPQVVSALNCARRGWINIEMDIIYCESCGSRLLFSTPSSWPLQQVEKAAKVFSLKLDSGHKLLCPWVDNTCDESLAQFPPKRADVLVEDFKRRCSSLLLLSALPVILPAAIDHMRNPQLQEFIKGPSSVESNDSISPSRSLTKEALSETYASYHQAQKLISLYGWEPHSLPYIVDCNVHKEQCLKDVNLEISSRLAFGGPNLNIICPLNDGCHEVHNNAPVPQRYAFSEPNSVVLNCNLCGASVGLWAFSSVPRPLESLRLVGYTDSSSKRAIDYSGDPAPRNVLAGNENVSGGTEGIHASSVLSMTSDNETSSLNLTIAGGPPPEKQNYRATISLPVIGRNLRARFSMDSLARKNHDIPLAQASATESGTDQIGESASNLVITCEKMQVPQDFTKDGNLAESGERVNSVVSTSDRSQIEEASGSGGEGNFTKGTGESVEGTSAIVLQAKDKQHALQGDNAYGTTEGYSANGPVLPAKNTVPSDSEKSLEHKLDIKSLSFDPIRQHRTFCPWIASYANSAPGWEQTLSALQLHKEVGYPSSENAPASMEVDDPIASVNKLFSSPPAKRTKLMH